MPDMQATVHMVNHIIQVRRVTLQRHTVRGRRHQDMDPGQLRDMLGDHPILQTLEYQARYARFF